jgi:hypothetical protein
MEGAGLSRQEIARTGVRGLAYPYSDEYKVVPANRAVLQALSEQTGGSFAPKDDEIFALRGDAGVTQRHLWPVLAGIALLLFVLDIVVRRAPWPRLRPPGTASVRRVR